jgi:hypothetical protein
MGAIIGALIFIGLAVLCVWGFAWWVKEMWNTPGINIRKK